jgi:GNAT superfamily N-acetyltransferase
MPVVAASPELRERIIDLTYPVWNEGLSRAAYARWNDAQLRTSWGRDHLQRVALVNGAGEVLASAKRYRFPARLNGRDIVMAGIGALFTPPERRGRGHATTLIRELLDRERAAGAAVAGLFSEIGPSFYQRLEFRPLPFDEVTIRVRVKGGAPAMLVRAGDERDLPAIAAMHDVRCAGAGFALRRDPALVHYALAKKRLLAGFGPAGLRQVEFFVVEEGASAVAYVVLSINQHGWTLEEAGDRDPAGARLGALLQVLVAREPSRRHPVIRTWWPAAFAVPPQIQLVDRSDPRNLFMLRPLADVELPPEARDFFYWHSDAF